MILFIASEVMFFVAWFWAYLQLGAVSRPIRVHATRERAVRRRRGRRRASRPSIPGICRC